MIKKTWGVFSIVINMCFYWCSVYLFSDNKIKARLEVKSRWQNKVDKIIRKYFFNKIKINGTIEKQKYNMIDVIMSNHISTIDFVIIITLLHNFKIANYYFVFKNSLVKIPVMGDLIYDDIFLARDWEQDKKTIVERINKIKNGTIVFYPEGTRFDNKKHKEALKFCYKNKLPFYNYTLAPKVRGLHLIINILHKEKRLGKIYDMTLIAPKFLRKNMYTNKLLFSNDLGVLHVDVREIFFKDDEMDYESFKKKLYYIWLQKNMIMDKFAKNKNIN